MHEDLSSKPLSTHNLAVVVYILYSHKYILGCRNRQFPGACLAILIPGSVKEPLAKK